MWHITECRAVFRVVSRRSSGRPAAWLCEAQRMRREGGESGRLVGGWALAIGRCTYFRLWLNGIFVHYVLRACDCSRTASSHGYYI